MSKLREIERRRARAESGIDHAARLLVVHARREGFSAGIAYGAPLGAGAFALVILIADAIVRAL